MNKVRHTRDETRARIMDQADVLFRQIGYTKTTVADIARELGMSPANIYKFFPSKNAIIEAAADRRLGRFKADLLELTGTKKNAVDRLLGVVLSIYRLHREDFQNEREIYKLVFAATEEKWSCVGIFKKFLFHLVADLVEDGVRTGEFRRINTKGVTQVLLDSFAWITSPLLFQELAPEEVEDRARSQVRFLKRALQ